MKKEVKERLVRNKKEWRNKKSKKDTQKKKNGRIYEKGLKDKRKDNIIVM